MMLLQTLSGHYKFCILSIITDTTQDISKYDQLTQVIRYATIDRNDLNVPLKIHFYESFLGFHEVTDQQSNNLVELILTCLDKLGLNLLKLRGKGYDGAANMSGVYSGFQARLIEKQLLAVYVHCIAHNLALKALIPFKYIFITRTNFGYFFTLLDLHIMR